MSIRPEPPTAASGGDTDVRPACVQDPVDLFGDVRPARKALETLAPGAALLPGFALPHAARLLAGMHAVLEQAPLRHMHTPGGFRMSVAMSNCGALGWVSDRAGYRYVAVDPDGGQPWPAMPAAFAQLARDAAALAGYESFAPDACLINRYAAGARLSPHQDNNERDYGQPIVSVSLGLPATFIFGGARRGDAALRVPLAHGDVVVWGGAARMRYHGVLALKDGQHALTGPYRYNLTLRRAA
jgi:alkylated DNA repair protein (DNA oxidative demethylase)